MPKVETPEAAERRRLKENLALIQGGRSDAKMGELINVSAATYGRRKRSPKTFTIQEIEIICKDQRVPLDLFLTTALKIGG